MTANVLSLYYPLPCYTTALALRTPKLAGTDTVRENTVGFSDLVPPTLPKDPIRTRVRSAEMQCDLSGDIVILWDGPKRCQEASLL